MQIWEGELGEGKRVGELWHLRTYWAHENNGNMQGQTETCLSLKSFYMSCLVIFKRSTVICQQATHTCVPSWGEAESGMCWEPEKLYQQEHYLAVEPTVGEGSRAWSQEPAKHVRGDFPITLTSHVSNLFLLWQTLKQNNVGNQILGNTLSESQDSTKLPVHTSETWHNLLSQHLQVEKKQ